MGALRLQLPKHNDVFLPARSEKAVSVGRTREL
jgi:hypothetical protein